ncbi:unknown [Brachyspira sp. CAG:700]|nr:unknown [Brachyspira sp. CAG:700]
MVIYDSVGVGSNIPVSSTYIKKTSDISYTATVTAESGTSEQYIFTFSSDTQGTVTISSDESGPIHITKK